MAEPTTNSMSQEYCFQSVRNKLIPFPAPAIVQIVSNEWEIPNLSPASIRRKTVSAMPSPAAAQCQGWLMNSIMDD
jgi:hypothetical protein